ncbi:MAG: MarR family transcriptional regulator [Paracoccaceae bacterium]|nr:MarR family transcriptional regulator [Paracoccaceae bacterium]
MKQFILANFLPYQLSILASGISRDFSKEYILRFSLSNAEWRIIAHLSQETETISIREIYQKVDLEKSKVSRAVSKLAKRKLLSKKVNLSDKRLVDLKLTKAGREILDEMTEIAMDFEARFLQKIENPGSFKNTINALLKN